MTEAGTVRPLRRVFRQSRMGLIYSSTCSWQCAAVQVALFCILCRDLLVASDDEDDDSDAIGRRLKDENVCICVFIIYGVGRAFQSRLSVCPRSKRKMARAINTKLGAHIRYSSRSACIDPEVKKSRVKVTRLRKPSQSHGC